MKKITFTTPQILNYWAEYTEIQQVTAIFLKFIISPGGAAIVDYSLQAPKKKTTTPLPLATL
jgi:hypothetical protein